MFWLSNINGQCGRMNSEMRSARYSLRPSVLGALPWHWRRRSSTGLGNAEREITEISSANSPSMSANQPTSTWSTTLVFERLGTGSWRAGLAECRRGLKGGAVELESLRKLSGPGIAESVGAD